MTQQLECSYAGCKSAAILNLPVCKMHFDGLLRKRGGKSAPSVPAVKERVLPSPPTNTPAPSHPTAARLPAEPDATIGLVKNVMRKTAPGARSNSSKTAPSAPIQAASTIISPPDSLSQQDGPERKKRRLEDRLEADQATRAPRDARSHVPGAPNARIKDETEPVRPAHTLSSQSFYGTRPTANGGSKGNSRAASAEIRTSTAERKGGLTAAQAPTEPELAPTPATQPTATGTPAYVVAETAMLASAEPPAEMPALPLNGKKAPPVPSYNPGLANWYSGALTKEYLTPNARAVTAPANASATNGAPQQPMVLSMPLATKAPDAGVDRKPTRGSQGGRVAPSKDRQCVRTATQQDLSLLDAFVYGQESAQLPPPRGVVLPAKPEPPKPRDEPFFAHIDPRVHWTRPHSEVWYEAKEKEISERPGRKANFGMAAQRMAERSRAERGRDAKSSSATSSATTSRSRQSSKSARDACLENGDKGGPNAAALARLRKSFDAWDQALWERDKEATRKESLKERSRKDRDKARPNGTGQASRR